MCCRYEEKKNAKQREMSPFSNNLLSIFCSSSHTLLLERFPPGIIFYLLACPFTPCDATLLPFPSIPPQSPSPSPSLSTEQNLQRLFSMVLLCANIFQSKPKLKWRILDWLSSYTGSWNVPFFPNDSKPELKWTVLEFLIFRELRSVTARLFPPSHSNPW